VSRSWETLVVLVAALAGLAGLVRLMPAYLTLQGFPLDDAWVHAVYARSLAEAGLLAFNPGIPAPGITSPLWAALLALLRLLAPDPETLVLASKLAGFALHAGAAVLVLRSLSAAGAAVPERLLGAGLVALHPDLIAGSVSGVEIPLAALAGCALLWAAQHERPWRYAAVSLLVPAVRPDLVVLSCAIPLAVIGGADRARLARFVGAAVAASLLPLVLLLGRDLALVGSLLPVVPPAAVETSLVDAQVLGFGRLLGQVPVTDSSFLVLLAAAAAVWCLWQGTAPGRLPAAALLVGLGFCVVSFALFPPAPPSTATGAFTVADQRYVLAALPLIVGTLPAVLRRGAAPLLAPRTLFVLRCALAALLVVSLAVHAPRRYMHLANDAQAVDDLQVSAGRSLRAVAPGDAVWAVFPGAIRYFGNGHVVDLSGARSPEVRGPGAASFLSAHPPRFIEIVPGRTEVDPEARRRMKGMRFQTRTRDTWTGSVEQVEQWLALCADETVAGHIRVDHQVLPFRCARGVGPAGPAPSR